METNQNALRYVDPQRISFDSDNPRGESEDKILEDNDFKKLVQSISDVGVIVPLVVKLNGEDERYILVDGERRLRASLVSQLDQVPIHIVSGDVDGRILAYLIHMHRKDWSKTAEAKSIMSIIKEIKKETPEIDDNILKQRLVKTTNVNSARIQDFLNLFNYDDNIVNLVIEQPNKHPISYIDQIEASFISPLRRNYPEIFEKYGIERLRKIMGEKFINKKLVKSRYLMDTFNKVFQSENYKDKIANILDEFLSSETESIDNAYQKFENIGQKKISPKRKGTLASRTNSSASKKSESTKTNKKEEEKEDEENVKNSTNFKRPKILLTSKNQISVDKLVGNYHKIANDLSEEEYEYISEAIKCLKEQCNKAATLMIWATGISRVLQYIEYDFEDFVESLKKMQLQPNDVCKHFVKGFTPNVKNIEELKFKGKDIQLLCFLHYKRKITPTQFKKLKAIYDTRNDSAHPTDIDISVNRIIEIFENIYDYILNNRKLHV